MLGSIAFRPLTMYDFTLLHRWLNTDTVMEWYGKKPITLEQVTEKYIKYVSGEKPTQSFIFCIDGIDAGYIQTYKITDYPEYNHYVETDEHSAGLDLYIGEKQFLHRGYGAQVMMRFLKEHVFSLPDIIRCIIGPEPANNAAIRAYEKAGFTYSKQIQLPDEDTPEYLMELPRERFFQNIDRA